jgi:hypothetical protein
MAEKRVLDFQEFKKQRDEIRNTLSIGFEVTGAKICDLLDKQDEMLQMLIHDVLALSDECNKLRAMSINIGASLSAVTITLEQEGVLKVSKIQEVWDRDLKPSLEKLEAANKNGSAPQSNILVPTSPTIIVP